LDEDSSTNKLHLACEILAQGNQTGIPPTIHPGTEKEYEWGDRALSDVRLDPSPEPLWFLGGRQIQQG
jgi:hypothetical protein